MGKRKKVGPTLKSKFEQNVLEQLQALKIPVLYEADALQYVIPESIHKYKPDWKLPNGKYIESKGIFDVADRKKILLLKEQRPDIVIYMLFYNARQRIRKTSKTTYADWCDKNGIEWSHREIKKEWLL